MRHKMKTEKKTVEFDFSEFKNHHGEFCRNPRTAPSRDVKGIIPKEIKKDLRESGIVILEWNLPRVEARLLINKVWDTYSITLKGPVNNYSDLKRSLVNHLLTFLPQQT